MLQENRFNRIFVFKSTISFLFFSHIEQAADKEIKLYRRKTKQNLHFIILVLCAGAVIVGDGNIWFLFSSSVQINIYKREIESSLKALTLRGNNATWHKQSFDSRFTAVHQTFFPTSFVPSSSWRRLSSSLFSSSFVFFFLSPDGAFCQRSPHIL